MDDVPFHQELEQLLRRRRHILEPLAERHHGEAHIFQVLHHLGGVPAVIGDFPYVVRFPQAFDKLLDEVVMDDVPFRRLDEALLLPDVVENMVPAAPQFQRVFRQPEERQQDVFLIIAPWRESQYQGRDIRCTGQVQPAVAHPSPQGIQVNGKAPLVVDLFRYPADAGRSPDIEPELLKDILFRRIFDSIPIGFPDAINLNGMPQRRIGFVPIGFIRPVFLMFQAIDHGVKGGIFLPARHQVQGLCVQFIADAVLVVACRGDDEEEWLLPGIAGALGQDIIELAVRLGVDFVKDQARHIESVFGPGFRRQHLVEPGVAIIDDALARRPYLGAAHQGRTHLDHLPCHIKDNGSLVAVTGRTIHFGTRLVIGIKKVQGDGCSQLAFPVLLWNLYIGRQELPLPVFLNDAEEITHNLFLPRQEQERLPGPFAFGMTEMLDEGNRPVGLVLVVMGIRQHER